MANFGTQISSLYSSISYSKPNTIIATTSWGYVSDSLKVQGASRFGTNSAFTEKSNIQSLVDSYCCQLTEAERQSVCGQASICNVSKSVIGILVPNIPSVFFSEDFTAVLPKALDENFEFVSISGQHVVGVDYNGAAFYSLSIQSPSWTQIPGEWRSASISGDAVVLSSLANAVPYYSDDIAINPPTITSNWPRFNTISLSGQSAVGILSNGGAFYSLNTQSNSWTLLPRRWRSASISGKAILGSDLGSLRPYYTPDITLSAPQVIQTGRRFITVSLSGVYAVGVQDNGAAYYSLDIQSSNPTWTIIAGRWRDASISGLSVVLVESGTLNNYYSENIASAAPSKVMGWPTFRSALISN